MPEFWLVAIPATSKIRHWTRPVDLGYGHTMVERKFLGEVDGLATPDDTRQFYDNWVESYDSEVSENGYGTLARVAEALARHASSKEIELLDFGCGTGLSGLALRRAGLTNIDGADLSADMPKGAAEKQVYRKLGQVDPRFRAAMPPLPRSGSSDQARRLLKRSMPFSNLFVLAPFSHSVSMTIHWPILNTKAGCTRRRQTVRGDFCFRNIDRTCPDSI